VYKKAWCKCKIVVLVVTPIAFLTFLLLSPLLDLKVSYILTYWYFKKTVWKSGLKCEEREYSKVNNGIHNWFWYTLDKYAEGGKTLSLCSLPHWGSFGLSCNPPQWTQGRNVWQSPKNICKGGYTLWACSPFWVVSEVSCERTCKRGLTVRYLCVWLLMTSLKVRASFLAG